jgi:tetratricopeptide (TPR) repeat protein
MRRLLQAILGNGKAAAEEALRQGNAALAEGRLDEAAECYRRALAADPSGHPARVNLAYVLIEQRQPAAATALLQQAAGELRESDALLPDAWFLLGQACSQQGDGAGAVDAYRKALDARRDFPQALQELVRIAHARYEAADDRGASQVLEEVLRRQPSNAGALAGRGHVQLRQGDFEAAAQSFREVLDLHGANAQRLVDLASASHRLGRSGEAAALAEQALGLEPQHAAALNLRVVSLTAALRLAEAEAQAREALRLHPDDADLHWSLCIALMLQGKLKQAWPEHRWRWRTSVMATSARGMGAEPAWQGEPLAGRSILLVGEQGFGDTLQFVRYVPLVAKKAARVFVQAPAALRGLLGELPANCQVVDPDAGVRADFHCALMDLPEVFGTGLDEVPAAIPYLRADPARVDLWKTVLGDDPRRRVGISCSGNPAHTNDRHRSIPLERWSPVLRAGCRFMSLQPELRASDLAAAATLPLDLAPARELRDFADTAALLDALDLVITVDTSVAHLAGAIGRPVWILLPYCPDWRWMVGRDDSPWYPSARLYRQPAPGDWDSVLRRVQADLAEWQP